MQKYWTQQCKMCIAYARYYCKITRQILKQTLSYREYLAKYKEYNFIAACSVACRLARVSPCIPLLRCCYCWCSSLFPFAPPHLTDILTQLTEGNWQRQLPCYRYRAASCRHTSQISAQNFGLRLLSAVRDKLVSSSVDCTQKCVDVLLLLSKEHHWEHYYYDYYYYYYYHHHHHY